MLRLRLVDAREAVRKHNTHTRAHLIVFRHGHMVHGQQGVDKGNANRVSRSG